MSDLWSHIHTARRRLNAVNGLGNMEVVLRLLKVAEETGEAAGALIGALGQNPRKGITHTTEQVVDELFDVAVTALVAAVSLDPAVTEPDFMEHVKAKVGRLPGAPASPDRTTMS